jgi:ribonuclease P protein subunit RPR2
MMGYKSESHARIASERMTKLFQLAESNFEYHPALSKRYVTLARKIAMRYRVRFSREQKKCFCKQCNAYLKQGKNATIRVRDRKIILRCMDCGFVRRFVVS